MHSSYRLPFENFSFADLGQVAAVPPVKAMQMRIVHGKRKTLAKKEEHQGEVRWTVSARVSIRLRHAHTAERDNRPALVTSSRGIADCAGDDDVASDHPEAGVCTRSRAAENAAPHASAGFPPRAAVHDDVPAGHTFGCTLQRTACSISDIAGDHERSAGHRAPSIFARSSLH